MRPNAVGVAINFVENIANVETVAHRRQAAVDRAGADGDQDLGVGAQLAQHLHVLGVAHAPFDQRNIAGTAMLDVGERRTVEFGDLRQFENTLVDVEQ